MRIEDLQGKSALVTGATSGIGLEIARQLASRGASVALIGLDEERGRAVAVELAALGSVLFLKADVGDHEEMEAAFARTHEAFGRLDFLVNNAGVLGGPRFPQGGATHWQRAIHTNQAGVLNGIFFASKYMNLPDGGSVLNVASTSGLTPNPVDPIYAMTKAAVVNLSRSLSFLEEEKGIRVNCVCPGLVATPLEQNSAQLMSDDDRHEFLARRAGRTGNPSLSPAEVAQAGIGLMLDGSLNGCCLRISKGVSDELIPNPRPHKL